MCMLEHAWVLGLELNPDSYQTLQNHIFKNHLDFAQRFLASNPPESTCKCKQKVTTQDSWPVHMSSCFYYT